MRSEEGEDGEDGDVDEVDAMEFREEGFGEESKMDEVGERLIKDVCVRGERVKGERPIMEAKKKEGREKGSSASEPLVSIANGSRRVALIPTFDELT